MPIVTQSEMGGQSLLALGGEMTLSVAVELRAALLGALSAARPLRCDLTAVEELDLAVLQILLAARAAFALRGIACEIIDSPQIIWARTLALAGVGPHLEEAQ